MTVRELAIRLMDFSPDQQVQISLIRARGTATNREILEVREQIQGGTVYLQGNFNKEP